MGGVLRMMRAPLRPVSSARKALHSASALQASGAAVFPPAYDVLSEPEDFLLKFDTPITPNPDVAPVRLSAPSNNPFADNKYTQVMGEWDACAVIAAHTHPRGTEMVFVSEGEVMLQMVLESGDFVTTAAKPGEMIIIPEGTVHVTSNPTCGPAKALVQLDHPEGATIFAGVALSQLPEEYLNEAFMGPLPAQPPPLFVSQACLERCGLAGGGTGRYGATWQVSEAAL